MGGIQGMKKNLEVLYSINLFSSCIGKGGHVKAELDKLERFDDLNYVMLCWWPWNVKLFRY